MRSEWHARFAQKEEVFRANIFITQDLEMSKAEASDSEVDIVNCCLQVHKAEIPTPHLPCER